MSLTPAHSSLQVQKKWDDIVVKTEAKRYLAKENKGGAIGVLVIPKLDLRLVVLEDASDANLRKAPSHLKETSYPGTKGNAAISGHRVSYGFPFRRLGELSKGDKIYFQNSSGSFSYKVTAKKTVLPNDLSILKETNKARITLITCDPPFSARYRLAVIAEES